MLQLKNILNGLKNLLKILFNKKMYKTFLIFFILLIGPLKAEQFTSIENLPLNYQKVIKYLIKIIFMMSTISQIKIHL